MHACPDAHTSTESLTSTESCSTHSHARTCHAEHTCTCHVVLTHPRRYYTKLEGGPHLFTLPTHTITHPLRCRRVSEVQHNFELDYGTGTGTGRLRAKSPSPFYSLLQPYGTGTGRLRTNGPAHLPSPGPHRVAHTCYSPPPHHPCPCSRKPSCPQPATAPPRTFIRVPAPVHPLAQPLL